MRVTLSDHALIRYMERRYGIDFEPYRKEIMTSFNISAIKQGAGTIKVNGLSLKVRDKCIVTVLNGVAPKGDNCRS